MHVHGCKLKRLLRPAVEAYLQERTCALAARRAGIARSTLFVWIKLPEFRRMVDQVLQERFQLGRTPVPAAPGSPKPQDPWGVGGDGKEPETDRAVA